MTCIFLENSQIFLSKETESLFLISWLNDEVIWLLRQQHPSPSFSIAFLSFSQKSKYFMPNGKEYESSIQCRILYFFGRFIFSLCLPTRKRRIGMHSSALDISLQ